MARRRPTEPTINPARGAALVVVAVLVGLFLLRNGLDTSEVVTASRDDTSTDSDATDGAADAGTDAATDAGTDSTDETIPAGRPPAEVPTIVLNGSGITGAAGRYSTVLAGAGYQLTNPNGDDADSRIPTTQILFAEGFEVEARAVAAAIGAPTLVPAPLGASAPGTIVGAQVVVVLGPDLANITPTTTATTVAADGATTTTAAGGTTTN